MNYDETEKFKRDLAKIKREYLRGDIHEGFLQKAGACAWIEDSAVENERHAFYQKMMKLGWPTPKGAPLIQFRESRRSGVGAYKHSTEEEK